MKQYEQVIEIMKFNDGYATLGFLNQKVDISNWKTQTPYASIRRIVQDKRFFFKIRPGLWALNEYRNQVLGKFNLDKGQGTIAEEKFSHTYFQGLVVEIGNLKDYTTYIPPQDKNKNFIDKPLKTVAFTTNIYDFSYPNIVNRAKTIDVIWFNKRKLPNSFFEIEHSTDIQNSLLKYSDLTDFNTTFYIISSKNRIKEYTKKINYRAFDDIKDRVIFRDYNFISNYHSKISALTSIGKL